MNEKELKKILIEYKKWLKCDGGQYADLRGADLDFSCFPLWCGSFNIKDDGHIAKQLLGHIARMDVKDKQLKKWINKIPKKYKNDICKRHDVKEL